MHLWIYKVYPAPKVKPESVTGLEKMKRRWIEADKKSGSEIHKRIHGNEYQDATQLHTKRYQIVFAILAGTGKSLLMQTVNVEWF